MDSTSTGLPTQSALSPSYRPQVAMDFRPAGGDHGGRGAGHRIDGAGGLSQALPDIWPLPSIDSIDLPSAAKRALDVTCGAAALLVALPLLALVSVAIKLDSRGPVLFKQVRVGRGGRPFLMLKLRTMCADAEGRRLALQNQNERSGPVFKMRADPRITRLGRLLRKYSVDELPQLINVVRGDMSLVGPRPALPSEVSQYEAWQCRRLHVKPGLTGLWQVNGRNAVDFEEWIRLDLEYVRRSSLGLDLLILAKTVPAVLKGTGV